MEKVINKINIGIMYYNTGEEYEGDWKDGMYDGQGKFIY